MGISAVDKLINLEKLSISPSFSVKTGKKQTLNVRADNINIINQAYVGTASEVNPNTIVARSHELLQSANTNNIIEDNINITLGPYMGIVKSLNLSGTRVHFELTISNHYDYPQVIKGIYATLGSGQVNFKLFFKVNENGSRQPDFNTRFPIIINSNGVTRLAVEFENLEQPLIKQGELSGEVVILTGEEKIVKKAFIFVANEAMVNTLNQLQKAAEETKSPIIFDAMIKS